MNPECCRLSNSWVQMNLMPCQGLTFSPPSDPNAPWRFHIPDDRLQKIHAFEFPSFPHFCVLFQNIHNDLNFIYAHLFPFPATLRHSVHCQWSFPSIFHWEWMNADILRFYIYTSFLCIQKYLPVNFPARNFFFICRTDSTLSPFSSSRQGLS